MHRAALLLFVSSFFPNYNQLTRKIFLLDSLVLFPSRNSTTPSLLTNSLPYCFHRLRNLSSEGEDNILSLFYKQDTTATTVVRLTIKLSLPPSLVDFLSRKTYDCLLPQVYRGTSEPIKGYRWDCQLVFSSSRKKLVSLRCTVIASNSETLIKECHFMSGLIWRRRGTRSLSFCGSTLERKKKQGKKRRSPPSLIDTDKRL